LAKEWIAGQGESGLIFYTDGQVRVYSGDLTAFPRHYVARERLCLRNATSVRSYRPAWSNGLTNSPERVQPPLGTLMLFEEVPDSLLDQFIGALKPAAGEFLLDLLSQIGW
jgi:hypothetical protein